MSIALAAEMQLSVVNLGSFKTLKEAQIAYNEKAIELFGDKAKLNIAKEL